MELRRRKDQARYISDIVKLWRSDFDEQIIAMKVPTKDRGLIKNIYGHRIQNGLRQCLFLFHARATASGARSTPS